MNKLTKKILLCSATLFLASGTVAQSIIVSADSQKVEYQSNTLDSSAVDSNFINKFDGAIKLVDNQFVIDSTLLPKNVSESELHKLQSLVAENNNFLKEQLPNISSNRIVETDNSITVGETHDVAVSESSGVLMQSRTQYHEGSTYVHYYWWGMRIGVSRTMLRKIGSKGVHSSEAINSMAGVLAIKRADAAAILGFVGGATWFLGTGLTKAPGGIVFNFTAGAPANGIWGLAWQ
ncbi:hypothetical protein QYH60_13955 (plasmid) [Lactococcus lactis subsp. lactis]|uniref:hypothetical protein n=1 Tax=Lactococcus lactis TaxID=1358 RepID=UPI002649032D|nr:hypothetical protein [Lactococcus lactis]WKB49998.1 hypothetical protein QYH60_13955 [Lactococcus lactis subsp. lactis]